MLDTRQETPVGPRGPRVHLGGFNGYTRCGIHIPLLLESDRVWIPPPGARTPGPVTCEFCRKEKAAPLMSSEPHELRLVRVFRRPYDFPHEYVARVFLVPRRGAQQAQEIIAHDLDVKKVRAEIEKRGYFGPVRRHEDDDSTILEVWM